MQGPFSRLACAALRLPCHGLAFDLKGAHHSIVSQSNEPFTVIFALLTVSSNFIEWTPFYHLKLDLHSIRPPVPTMRSSYGILLVSSALLAVVSAKPSVPYGASDSVWKQQHDEAIPHHGGSVVDSAASLLQLNKRQAVSDQSVVLGQASSQWFDDEHYRQAQRSRHAKHHRGFTGSSSAGTPPVGAFTHQNDRGKLVYTALTGAEVERLWDQCDAFLQSNIPQTTESQVSRGLLICFEETLTAKED